MKHKGYTAGKWIDAPWFYENGKYRKTMVQTDKTAVAEVLDLYRPDDLENKEMQANARLIADAPRLAEEVERLRAINAELVEACRELVRVASHIKDAPLADALKYVPISAYHQARAKGKTAIAHAEGRES